jgi:predicted 3-demethylubiquinone-9 3-methyltransferase (glyoxalase superfamily)
MKETPSDMVSDTANDTVDANREYKEEFDVGKKITPCLWFDGNAEDAANFYVATFPDSEILGVQRWGEGGHAPAGTVLTVSIRLGNLEFTALNGGPEFKFTEAVSFQIDCESQDEVDHYWNSLTADGGEESYCGWLKDRFGLSWQVIPRRLMELLQNPDADKANRAMQAMLQMRKIDVAKLEEAAA